MFPPNIDPQTFTLSACLIGAIIAPELNNYESNTVGNWLVMVGDYLITYSGQQSLLQSRTQNNNNNNIDLNTISNALDKIYNELEKLKNEGFNPDDFHL